MKKKEKLRTYSRYFCIIDSVCVGLYWPKYSNIVSRWRNFFGALPELEELTFKEWFNMYAGLGNKNVQEHLIIQGWKNKNTLYFNQNLFFTDGDKYKNILRKIYDYVFYKKINSKGYLCIKIFGIRILKVKIKKQ